MSIFDVHMHFHSQSKNNSLTLKAVFYIRFFFIIHLSSECNNFTRHTKVCNLILIFFTKVCNLKLLFCPKHTVDVLVFFSQVEITGRKLNVG